MPSLKRERPLTNTDDKASKAKRPKPDADKPATAAASSASLLNPSHEVDFVRGGGTSLSQAEVEEARLEERAEHRASSSAGKRKDRQAAGTTGDRKKRRKDDVSPKKEKKEDGLRVDHLTYKRLVPGTRLLGTVAAIGPLELVLSLPMGLLGHVPITSVSAALTARLSASGSNSDEEDEESDGEDDTPSLTALFKLGQYLPCVVVASHASTSHLGLSRGASDLVRQSRRVELSVEPVRVNVALTSKDLQKGLGLTAAVKIREDHGFILELGVKGVEGFLGFKEADDVDRIEQGQLLTVIVKELKANGRTCAVAARVADVAKATPPAGAAVATLLPGAAVQATVTTLSPSGLNVKFLGLFEGTVALSHVGAGKDAMKDFQVGQKVKARVLWEAQEGGERRFALSLAKHVVELTKVELPQIGEKVQAKVVSLESDWGLIVALVGSGKQGFAHISNLADTHLSHLAADGAYRPGSTHAARVVGRSECDGMSLLSLQPSVLDEKYLRVADVKVGELVEGTIKKLTGDAVIIKLSEKVDAVAFKLHWGDVALRHPEKKFKEGGKVKGRVWAVDEGRERVVLTLKKSLLTEEPLVKGWDEATPGTETKAVVSQFLPKSVLVDLAGGLRALVPAREAHEEFTSDLTKLFNVGKVVTVRILSATRATEIERAQIVASVRAVGKPLSTAAKAQVDRKQEKAAELERLAGIKVGATYSGVVTALHSSNLVLSLGPEGAKAIVSYSTLGKKLGVPLEDAREKVQVGDMLDGLVVVAKDGEKAVVGFGAAGKASAGEAKKAAAKGDEVEARVIKVTPLGDLLVQLPGKKGWKGRVDITELSDDYDSAAGKHAPRAGQVLDCVVLDVDEKEKRLDLSARSSRLAPPQQRKKGKAVAVRDPVVASADDLKVGQQVRGFVKAANNGVFVTLGMDVSGKILIKDLFGEFVKDWQPRFPVGTLVSGRVLSTKGGRIDLTLKSSTAIATTLAFSDLEIGRSYPGKVTTVAPYGAFVRLEGSECSGLLHKSQIGGGKEGWEKNVHGGVKLDVKVLELKQEGKKISLALDLPTEDNDGDDDDDDDELIGDDLEAPENEEQEDADEEDEDEDEEMEDSFAGVDAADSDEQDEGESDAEHSSKGPAVVLDWEGGAAPGAAAESSDEDEDADEDAAGDDSEDAVDEVDRDASDAPQNVADFEKLLLGSPNSSYLWIQFIAFFLSSSEVDKARKTARRALEAIHYREEGEKLNVWLAMLNLENRYGTPEQAEAVFAEALRACDEKTVFGKWATTLADSGKFEAAEEIYQRFVKKLHDDPDAWTAFGAFYLNQGKANEARDLLQRSLKSIRKKQHVATISKFAQLEFKLKHGEAERGRTLFEGIVASYPKRLDVWFVYIDMEAHVGNLAGVRSLCGRILTQKWSSKKGKSVFKKWLGIEKEKGDEESCDAVLDQARGWVAKHSGADDEEEEED